MSGMQRQESAYEVAVVVRDTTIVAKEAHRVPFSNVLRVVLHELLDTVPESGNRLHVFVQAEHEAVLLVILLHEAEGVVVDIAEQLDAGLDAPVVFVVHHQRLTEEKARLEAAHVAVADAVTVDDLALGHVLAHLLGLVLVDVVGERPVLLGNLAVVRLARHQRRGDLLERRIERLVIEEDPVVVVAAIETILDVSDRFRDLPDVGVACKSDKGCVDSWALFDAIQVVPARVIGRHRHRVVGGVKVTANLGRRLLGNGFLLYRCCRSLAAACRGLWFAWLFFMFVARLVNARIEGLDLVGARDEVEHC